MELWNHFCPGCMREIKENKAVGIGKDEGNAEKSAGRGHGQTVFRCPHCGFSESEYKQNPRCLPLNTILAGKYLVGKVLGEGGFGITYMGYDLNMKTRIAIKEYFPVELVSRDTTRLTSPDGRPVSGGGSDRVISLSGEKSKTYQQGLKKYVDEARNVSQFAGIPGIVSVKDFFYENDTAYIVMEYIEGVSLKEYLRQKGGQLSEEEALAIMRPVLEALEKVHAAGIVHRDISPDNIMLTFGEQGMAKQGKAEQPPATNTVSAPSTAASAAVYGDIAAVRLIDFGAARMTSKNDQKSLTIILKHGYAPEEQYRSHGEQGPWTDVYALCAVLYRMLTGKVPEPAMDRLFSDGLKRPEELGVKVTPAVSEAILRGLAVKKENRIQSVRELMDALYAGKKLKKRGNGKLSRPVLIAAAAAGVLVLAVSAFGIAGALQQGGGKAGAESFGTSDGAAAKPAGTPEGAVSAEGGSDAGEEAADAAQNGQAENAGEVLTLEETQEDEDWEVLVERTPQTSCAGGYQHVVFLKEDGTVVSRGNNSFGQRNLSEWKRVAAVAAGYNFTAGLLENGTVLVAGEFAGKETAERWENVAAIAGGGNHLFGLTMDGRILSAADGSVDDLSWQEWENVKVIAAGNDTLAALTGDGRVLTANMMGTEWEPVEVSGWEDVTVIACNQSSVFGIRADGTVARADMWAGYTDGFDYSGVDNFEKICQLYTSTGAVYGVTEDGRVQIVDGLGYQYAGESVEHQKLLDMEGWEDLAGVAGTANGSGMAGMKKDGSLVESVANYGNSTPEEMKDLAWIGLTGMTRYSQSSLVGFTRDGEALTYGGDTNSFLALTDLEQDGLAEGLTQIISLYYMRAEEGYGMSGIAFLNDKKELLMRDPESWRYSAKESGVKQVFAPSEQPWCAVLKEDGTVSVLSLSTDGSLPESLSEAEGWTGIVQLAECGERNSPVSVLMGLKEDGTVVMAGIDYFPRNPVDWTGIRSIHAGEYAIGAIREDGTALFYEENPEYNSGQYNTEGWTELTQLALGLNHTAGLRSDGTVYAAGRNDAGQCEVGDWTDVVYLAAGDNCTLGITSDGTLLVAGEVGW